MKKILYLHIGHYKTGTTALQWFLTGNPRYLANNGLEYCDVLNKNNKHSRLAFSILRAVGVETLMHGYANPVSPKELWTTLFDAVRKSKQPATIVSTEEFMRFGEFPAAAEMLAELVAMGADIDIRVIVYLRPPHSHLQSWYNQLVKMGISVPGYNAAINDRVERVHYDYAKALKPWVDIFGADKVDLRAYVRGGEDGTALLADFMSAVGAKWQGSKGLKLPKADPNPRLDPQIAQLKQLLQGVDIPAETVDWTLGRAVDYFESDAGLRDLGAQGFERIRQTASQGIEAIADLAGADLTAQLSADLPMPASLPEDDDLAWRLSGFLLSELHLVRQKAQRTNAQLTRRLDALEARLGKGK